MTSSSRPAIIKISVAKKDISRINYSRRMYAIIRRYTPNVVEGLSNECYADLTGLRTFFKMTYTEMTEKIVTDLKSFLYLVNTELEFSDGLNGKGFYFNNPNASRSCGCGESFAV